MGSTFWLCRELHHQVHRGVLSTLDHLEFKLFVSKWFCFYFCFIKPHLVVQLSKATQHTCICYTKVIQKRPDLENRNISD